MSRPSIVLLLSCQVACYFGKIEMVEQDTGYSCYDDAVIEHQVVASQDPSDPCRYETTLTEAEAGRAWIGFPTTPSEYSSGTDELFLEIETSYVCSEPSSNVYGTFAGVDVASDYEVDYDATCTWTCEPSSMLEETVTIPLEICDQYFDYPGSGASGPPPPPADGGSRSSRTGMKFSGIYWYQALSRSGGYTCTLVRYKPAGNSHVFSGLVLSTESTQGNVTTHTFVDQAWLPRIASITNATATITVSGNNRIVSGTLGSEALDEYYDLINEELTFVNSNMGPNLFAQDRWTFHEACARLRSRQQ